MTTKKEVTMESKERQEEANQKPLTFGDIIERYNLLNQRLNLKGVMLLWKRDRNLTKLAGLKADIELDKRFPKTEQYLAYEADHIKLFEKHATDEDGIVKKKLSKHPITGDSQEVYDFDVTSKEYQKDKADLDKKHVKAIEERTEHLKQYSELLATPYPEKVTFQYVTLEDLPEDITETAFSAISWMILD